MSRRQARQDAVCLAYEIDIQGDDPSSILNRFFDTHVLKESDAGYISEVIDAVFCHKDEIDKYIEISSGRHVSYLAKVDLAILRVAIAEMLYMDSIPYKVSIDEAVELAKRYGDRLSPAFINGVLAGSLKLIDGAKA